MDRQKLSEIVTSIDKRLAVIEERTEGLSKLRERVAVNSAVVALFVSLLTAFLAHSISPHEIKTNSSPVPSTSSASR